MGGRMAEAASWAVIAQGSIVRGTVHDDGESLGWELYLEPDVDARAVGDRILEAGKLHSMAPTSAEAFRARRITVRIDKIDSIWT